MAWYTYGDDVFWDVFINHGTCTNNAAITNGDTWADHYVGTNPDVFANDYWLVELIGFGTQLGIFWVLRGGNGNAWADHGGVTNGDKGVVHTTEVVIDVDIVA